MRRSLALASLSLVAATACTPPDPRQDLEVSGVETYWAVDAPRGETQYIAPVVRFRLRNRTAKTLRSVDAQASFRRVGEKDEDWASGSAVVATSRQPLAAGADAFVELKGEGRYSMRQAGAEEMLKNEGFKDAKANVFLREGNSSWTKLLEVQVERRIGSRNAVIPTMPAPPDGPKS
jgi:hypothetical protein